MTKRRSLGAWLWSAVSMMALVAIVATSHGCGGGGGGNNGGGGGVAPGGPLPGNGAALPPAMAPFLDKSQDLPGMNVAILGVTGGSGPGGALMVGDFCSVTFTIKTDDGTDIPIHQLNSASIYMSGPTANYQPVLDRETDLRTFSLDNGDGTFTYNWQLPVPATYLPGFNDTPDIGPEDGDWNGMPLIDGTYTFGIEMYKFYDVEGDSIRDAGFGSMDVLFGNATVIEPREVVTTENCNSCHVELRFHGGFRRETLQCALCHTAGAEDTNDPNVLNGTPGVTVDFGPLMHRIHIGKYLPSNLGISTLPSGARDYNAPVVLNQITRNFRGTTNIYDYSKIAFPVWPSLNNPMPRDAGYSALGSTEQDQEDAQRSGVVACHKCHGDPDGSGPLPAPAQGDNAYSHPTRQDCGSCHDDWVFDRPYSSNNTSMPPQPDNNSCLFCHPADGGALPSRALHVHPMVNDAVSPDIEFDVLSLTEAGTNDGSGSFEPGEKMQISFTVKTTATGVDVPPGDINRYELSIAGPVNNRQLLHTIRPPNGALGAGPVYTMNVPIEYRLEYAGNSTASNGDVFMTAQAPHWTPQGTTTTVESRLAGGMGNSSTLSAAALANQNFIDVVDGTQFLRNDHIVIDDGVMGFEEYMRIQYVDGNRLWFSSPYSSGYKVELTNAHPAAATVMVVTLNSKTEGMDYSLDPVTGAITELVEFGANARVIVTYTSDWVVPATYGTPLNGSPDFDETRGKWTYKSLVEGTYTFGIWGRRSFSVDDFGESTGYYNVAKSDNVDFQVGVGSPVTSYDIISSLDDCNSCHDDMWFHGNNRRGFDACIMCHGTTAAEDRPQYVAANAGATTDVGVSFRDMLHKIHMGKELDDASNYVVNGFGFGYPNNFAEHHYDEVVFPPFNGETRQCTACHGSSDSWEDPGNRSHPTEQMMPSLDWTVSCSSCHNSPAAGAHMALQMSGGVEACSVCHGEDKDDSVQLVHKFH